jgi:predicted lipoprotein with Yx(FWY)xxD motif
MKSTRILLLAGIVAGALGGVSAAASARGAGPTARASRVAKVQLRHTKVGTILVSSSGFTLYEFSRDHGHDSCVRISGCSELWPALQTSGRPIAGPGVHASSLSSISLSGGAKQVTYDGHPLYMYSGDTGPGETAYVGERAFGGSWDALTASGHAVS